MNEWGLYDGWWVVGLAKIYGDEWTLQQTSSDHRPRQKNKHTNSRFSFDGRKIRTDRPKATGGLEEKKEIIVGIGAESFPTGIKPKSILKNRYLCTVVEIQQKAFQNFEVSMLY
jgi:hypothetical protein